MTDDKALRAAKNAKMEVFANLLEDALREINSDTKFSWKKMFGGAGYYADDVMFAGMYTDGALSLKLQGEDQTALLMMDGAKEGFGKNTIDLPESVLENKEALQIWVSKSLDYAASRPPKKKKKK